ncbi:MAG: hypothetical protein M1825_005435 [Sarcosagium campestre]|nr:MAG: hypothetical protein M1825_005435 [Sarcosagium campestre]
MNTCNRLSRAEFFAVRNNGPSGSWDNDLPELRCFRISGVESFMGGGPTDLDLTHFAERAPNLVELAVSYNTWGLTGDMGLALNVKPLAHLESLNLRAVRVWAFPLLAPNIRTLKLNDLRIMQDDLTGEFRVEGADLTDLTTLEFDDYSRLKVSDLRTLLDPSRGKLKILSIAGSNMDQQELEMMAHEGYFANLTNFGAHGTMMQDNFVEALAHNARYLQQVDLSKTAITGIAVKALVVNCPLVSLNLGLCSYISIDAVEWARQKGVNVEFYLQDNLKYSKKTRVGYPLVLNV